MRRIIMATIIAVTFIPGVASAQTLDPNKVMEMINNLQRDKHDICTLKDDCVRVYDTMIEKVRLGLDAQKRLADAESRSDRDAQLEIKGEMLVIGQDVIAAGHDLNNYLQSRGYVVGSR